MYADCYNADREKEELIMELRKDSFFWYKKVIASNGKDLSD